MPSIDWAFLCDYAFVDTSGKASIIGVFENINALNLPMTHAQMYVALGMKLVPGDNFEVSAKVTSPAGKEITQVNPQRISIPANALGTGKGVIAFGFYGTQFSETGEHHIEIFLDGNSIHFIPINVALITRK
jgi:hypothetical protein